MFKYLVSLTIVVFLVLAVNAAATNTYTLTYHSTNTSATAGTIEGMSIKEGEGVNVALTERGYFTGTNFDIGVNYYSPDSTPIGTATRTGLTQIVCSSFGTYSTSTDLNSIMEGYADYTASADDGNLTLTSVYSITESSLYYDIEADMTDTDSFGNLVYRYGGTSDDDVSNYSLVMDAYESSYSNCFSEMETHPPYIYIGSSGTLILDYRRTAYAYYPFNSGPEGIVKYWFNLGNATYPVLDCTDSCTGTQSGYFDVFLVNVEDESYTTLYSTSGDCFGGFEVTGEIEDSLTLDSDTEYMIVTASRNDDTGNPGGCSREYKHREPLAFNISVYVYEPDWNCSDWSTCTEGEQRRICNDLNGIATPKTVIETCSVTVLENATLGFEEFTTDFALKCIPNWLSVLTYPTSGSCSYDIQNITRDTPVGWTVYEDYTDEGIQRDFLRMTSEWKTEGSRSLKMWYIPPKQGEPLTNTTCGNTTYGMTPLVTQTVSNDTFSVSYNVSFPSTNMLLRFDVKGCKNQVVQNDALYQFFLETCPQQCYAGNCSTTPEANYQFFMKDQDGKIITNYYENADTYVKSQPQIDLTNIGIVAGQNYTLNFQAMPENLNSQAGNCVMFDNVRYEVLEESFLSVIGGDCSIGEICINNDLYETHQYENGACVVVKTEYSCGLPEDIQEKADNLEPYCIDSNTLRTFDFDEYDWFTVDCENGCSDGACVTEEDAAESETPTTTSDTLGTDMLGFLTEPFTWAVIITLLSVIITAIFLGMFNVRTGASQISLGVGLVTNVFFIVAEWTPFWWGLMISAGLILLISNKIVDLSGVGGG